MKKIIICDDDIKFVELFEQQIYKYFTNCNHEVLIERYYSAENLILSGIKTIDIAFLDVEMKDVNGIQLGYEIQKKQAGRRYIYSWLWLHEIYQKWCGNRYGKG